jgi:hypothetical protein
MKNAKNHFIIKDMDQFIKNVDLFAAKANENHRRKWCLTGSAAVVYTLHFMNDFVSRKLLDSEAIPGDLDVLLYYTGRHKIVSPISSFVGYERIKIEPWQDSKGEMYIDENSEPPTIDLILSPSLDGFYINDVPICDPKRILTEYEDVLETRGEKRVNDISRIEALKHIISSEKFSVRPLTVRKEPITTNYGSRVNLMDLFSAVL